MAIRPPPRRFDLRLSWTPRVVAVLFATAVVSTGMYEFRAGPLVPDRVLALVMHILLAMVVLGMICAAWRNETVGELGAFGFIAFYLWTGGASTGWEDTSLIIGGLVALGALYAWNAERHRTRPAPAGRRSGEVRRISGEMRRITGEVPQISADPGPSAHRSSGAHRVAQANADREPLHFLTPF